MYHFSSQSHTECLSLQPAHHKFGSIPSVPLSDQTKADNPLNLRSEVYSYPAHHLPETQDISGIPLPFL